MWLSVGVGGGGYLRGPCLRATVCVVPDVAAPPRRMKWVLALRGGVALAPLFLESDGRSGAALPFKAAIATPRQVWLSPAFQGECPQLTDVVRVAAVSSGSKWKLLVTRAAFQAALVKAHAKGRRWPVIALVTRREARHEAEMTAARFFRFCSHIEDKQCVFGMCSR